MNDKEKNQVHITIEKLRSRCNILDAIGSPNQTQKQLNAATSMMILQHLHKLTE